MNPALSVALSLATDADAEQLCRDAASCDRVAPCDQCRAVVMGRSWGKETYRVCPRDVLRELEATARRLSRMTRLAMVGTFSEGE